MPVTKVLPLKPKVEANQKNTFKSMKIPHAIGSYLGLLPTHGIMSDNVADLNFRWISLKTTYTILYFFMGSYLLFKDILWFVKSPQRMIQLCNNVFSNVECAYLFETYFFTVTLNYHLLYILVFIAFFVLSRGLKRLMFVWTETDKALNRVYGYPRSLDFRIKLFTVGYFIITTGAFVFKAT